MENYDFRSFEHHHRWWNRLEYTTLASTFSAVIAGAYVLFKALELLGYPVWLWSHQLVYMFVGILRLRGASGSSESGSSGNTMGVLSSLFGFDGGSLLQKGVRGITGALSSAPRDVPPGLGNINNSCYQNSVMQGLSALPSLRNYLTQITADNPAFTAETMYGALHDMVSKLNDPNSQGQNFWISGKLKSMSTFEQQDAQEYYSTILDELEKEMKKASSSRRRSSVSWFETTADHDSQDAQERTIPADQGLTIPNPLEGRSAQRVGCTACGYSEGLILNPLSYLTVSLGTRNDDRDIRDCLDEYTSLEYIDGVDCAKCTLIKLQDTLTKIVNAQPESPLHARLDAVTKTLDDEDFEDNTLIKTLNIPRKNWVQSRKSKQIVIGRAPKALVVHVNRSIFDETTGAQFKNNAYVSYPGILDLGNWCLGISPSGSQQPDVSIEEWPRDPKCSLLPHQAEAMTTSPFQYRLRAAVTHFGTHGYGHYVCYRPHSRIVAVPTESENAQDQSFGQPDERWWRFSDESVTPISEQQAHQGNVFMLFYERLEDDEVISAPSQEITTVPQDAPLPPADLILVTQYDDKAAEIPLPDEDDLFDLTPPASPIFPPDVGTEANSAHNTDASEVSDRPMPPPDTAQSDQDTETEVSEAEGDFEDIQAPPTSKAFTLVSPHMMRTAGNAATRGQGSRQSLPLISAT
jgi:ubiquitin carboxyl-terminal hydrolase 1